MKNEDSCLRETSNYENKDNRKAALKFPAFKRANLRRSFYGTG